MSLREAQKERGRDLIRDAAEELFLADGYSGTPVTAVAKRAGVAEKTVYNLFESKPRLLLDLFHVRVAGEGDDVLENQHQRVGELEDAEAMIDEFCLINQAVAERVLPLLRVVIEASSTDPEVADRLHQQERHRQIDQFYLIDALRKTGRLRQDRSEDDLGRALWLAAAPELVIKAMENGWNMAEYTDWLRETLNATLLSPAVA